MSFVVKEFPYASSIEIKMFIDGHDRSIGQMVIIFNSVEVGGAYLYVEGLARIFIIGIEDPFKGKGYGTKLMTRAKEIVKERGFTSIVVESSQKTAEFYEKNGFKRCNPNPYGKSILMLKYSF